MKKVLLFLMAVLAAHFVSAGQKTIYKNALVLAYSPANNVYEDDNIKLEIYNQQAWITNKTSKTVFLDLSQCFVIHNGSSSPMYEQQTTRKDDKKASKAKVSLSIDEFLSIAPATGTKQNETFVCSFLGTGLYKETYGTTENTTEEFTEYEKRMLTLVGEMVTESQKADPKGKQYIGTVSRHLTEDESIDNIGISIAYAFNKKAEEWTTVTLTTWVSDVIFAPFYIKMPKDISKKEQRGFGIKETAPAMIHIKAESPFEFDKDKSPITVCDWRGEFKKGTFSLKPTLVAKEKKTNIFATLFTLGMANLYNALDKTYYKSKINFDGTKADWGKMEYLDDDDDLPLVETK